MDLLIDTTQRERIYLSFLEGKRVAAKKVMYTRKLSENLVFVIGKFLEKHKVKLKFFRKILVNPGPGGFSSTRTGVAVANALAFALQIPVAEWPGGRIKEVAVPIYDKAPNITKSNRGKFGTM